MKKSKLRITRSSLLLIAFVAAFTFIIIQPAFAQDNTPPTDNEVNAVAHKLYCPVCENTPLDVCPTDACKDWRALIRTMLADGKTEDEILRYFVDQYGDRVLAAPPLTTKFNWLIYLLPPAIILAGAFILFRSLKEWTKSKVTSSGLGAERIESSAAKDDYVARLEEELKKQK